MNDRAKHLAALRAARDEWEAGREIVARILRALPYGVPLRSIALLAEAKRKVEQGPRG